MASKQQFGEQLIKLINGGNYTADSKITLRQAMLFISQARDEIVKKYLWQTRYELDDYIYGGFLSTYKIKTKYDEGRNLAYLPLTARPIWLPNNEGIFQVCFPQDEFNSFIPMSTGSDMIFGGLESGWLEGNIGYYPERDRLWLKNFEDEGCEILIKMIASAESIGDLDFFPIAPDLEKEMLQSALSLSVVQREQPQDNTNDNADIR